MINLKKKCFLNIHIEEKAKKKYEARLNHLVTSLSKETFLILFPWVFKDEEGHKRDKKSSPPYLELTQTLFPGNFSVEQEMRQELNDDLISLLNKEVYIIITSKPTFFP